MKHLNINRKRCLTIVLILIAAQSFISCEKVFVKPPGKTDPVSVFDEFYKVMDDKFILGENSGFNHKPVMDSMRNVLIADPSQQMLNGLFKTLVQKIADGHTKMLSEPVNAFYIYDYTSGYQNNINPEVLLSNYLDKDPSLMTVIKDVSPQGKPRVTLAYGLLPANPQLAYLYLPNFEIDISDKRLDEIFGNFKNAKALIVDIRGNGGGYINLSMRIASRLFKTDKPVGILKMKEKKGAIKNIPLTAVAYKGNINFTDKPVVVLIDRRVFSAATMFAEILKATINPVYIGQRSGGGTSGFTSGILSGDWEYSIANSEPLFYDQNGKLSSSNNGFEPDYKVLIDTSATNGDAVLEKAIELLR